MHVSPLNHFSPYKSNHNLTLDWSPTLTTKYNHCERWHGTVLNFGKQTMTIASTQISVRNEMFVKYLCPLPSHIWLSLTLTFDLVTWISTHQGLYTYTSRTIYLPSLKLLGQIWIITSQWTNIPNDQHVQSNIPSLLLRPGGGHIWKTQILIRVPTLKLHNKHLLYQPNN